jgi:starvation-inducible DNA-binding protein
MFNSLHLMFETQYTELATAVDEIAERIRALGVAAPGSYAQFAELTSIEEETGQPKAKEMIAQLVKDQETVARTARAVFPLADAAADEPTADLLTQRLQVHEKTAWMLRSLISQPPRPSGGGISPRPLPQGTAAGRRTRRSTEWRTTCD